MKRIFESALLIAALFTATSCIVELGLISEEDNIITKEFTAHSDAEVETRTALDEDFRILWKNTDHITVFDGNTTGKTFSDVTTSNDSRTAVFKGEVALVDTYYAIYPAQDDAIYSSGEKKITAVLPTFQTGLADTFADGVNLSIAKTEGSDLYFKNVGALLAVKCPTSNAKSIRIVSKYPGVKMSGKAVVDFNDGEPTATPSSEAVNYVELKFSEKTTAGAMYYFVVYPGDYKGFDIIFTSKWDPSQTAIYSTSKELSLRRNDNIILFNPTGLEFNWNSTTAPYNVQATLAGPSGLAGVDVAWESNANKDMVAGYNIYARPHGSASNGNMMGTVGKDARTYLASGLSTESIYDFGVQTKGVDGKKDSEIVWVTDVKLPAVDKCIAPSKLAVDQLDETSVKLSWSDNSGGEIAYMVYKDDENTVNSAETSINATSYTFKQLIPGKTYKFGVQTRGAYNNHSDVIYTEYYTVMGWKDLQDYDAGDLECLKPHDIKYIQETSSAVYFSWECWSSANTGFNLYARPAAETEFNSTHLVKQIDRNTKTYTFTELTTATEYVFGIQTAGKSTLENSDIVEIGLTVKNFDWPYPFESGRSIPTFSDLALCYGGNCERNPQYWTPERFKHTVTYKDKNGKEHWLFESMLMLELYSDWSATSYALTADGHNSSRREHCQQQLDYWFDNQYGFAALDQCIEEAKARIGSPSKKHIVIFSLPDPVYFENFKNKTNTIYWGSIAGVQMDFSSIDHRVEAYKWMINQVRALFNAKGYKNIELGGFYILNESLSISSNSYNYKYKQHDQIIKKVTAYCHSFNEGVFWIPYNCAEGYTAWKSLGIDCAIMQPNKYWPDETTKTWNDVLTAVKNYDMGIELEFEGTHGEYINSSILTKLANGSANQYADVNKESFRTYLTKIKSEPTIYKKKPIALYTGTNALYELASSTDEADKTLYHELCQFILDAKH